MKDDTGRVLANLPCQRPPWARLVAVNANTGDIAWQVPLGITEALPGKRNTGGSGSAGPIATTAALSSSARRTTAGSARSTRRPVRNWVAPLPGVGNLPITYTGRTASSTSRSSRPTHFWCLRCHEIESSAGLWACLLPAVFVCILSTALAASAAAGALVLNSRALQGPTRFHHGKHRVPGGRTEQHVDALERHGTREGHAGVSKTEDVKAAEGKPSARSRSAWSACSKCTEEHTGHKVLVKACSSKTQRDSVSTPRR
jgi:hypothetical protein